MPGLDEVRCALVIAPHPDDEVLGCGGTISRLTRSGRQVHVAIVTQGSPPAFDEAAVQRVRRETHYAHRLLGLTKTHFCGFPAAELDQVPHREVNAAIGAIVEAVAPDTLFLPFVGDVHLDHQLCFTSGLVAARPRRNGYPARVLAYETLSETNWYAPYVTPGFTPNVFVDISEDLERKIEAFGCYGSQVQAFPSERSVEAIRALATLRGATVFKSAAEAFVLLREVS